MGSTAGAFLGGLNSVLGPKLQQQHDDEQKAKKEKIDFYQKIALDPANYSQAEIAEAQSQLNKLWGPETKKGFAKIAPILEKLHGAHRQANTPSPDSTQGPTPAPQAGVTAPSAAPAAVAKPPLGADFDKLQADRADKTTAAAIKSERDKRSALISDIKANPDLSKDEKDEAILKAYGVAPRTQKESKKSELQDKLDAIEADSHLSPSDKAEARRAAYGVHDKPVPEADKQLPNVVQMNQILTDRYQVLNPGKPLPLQFVLPPNATNADYTRIDKALESQEKAVGTKAQQDAIKAAREQAKSDRESNQGTWVQEEDEQGNPVLRNTKTNKTEKSPTVPKGTYAKNTEPIVAAKSYAEDYLKSGQFDGPGDEALMEKFFELAKPSSGFRMSAPQQKMLMDARGAVEGLKARGQHLINPAGPYFGDGQRQKIVKTMKELAEAKMKSLPGGSKTDPSTGGIKIISVTPVQ